MKVENRKIVCPHCEGAYLEKTTGNFPHNDVEHYICPKCDSTYLPEQVEYFSRMGAND